jgi:hypothetical protein
MLQLHAQHSTDVCRDQELRFTVHDSPDYNRLKISVFNDDKKTELIGETWANLSSVITPGGGQSDEWHPLNCKGKYAGEIRMEVTYYDIRAKAEKPVEKKRESARADGQSPAVGGPRESMPVRRRPLPSDPTGATPPPSNTPEYRGLAEGRAEGAGLAAASAGEDAAGAARQPAGDALAPPTPRRLAPQWHARVEQQHPAAPAAPATSGPLHAAQCTPIAYQHRAAERPELRHVVCRAQAVRGAAHQRSPAAPEGLRAQDHVTGGVPLSAPSLAAAFRAHALPFRPDPSDAAHV